MAQSIHVKCDPLKCIDCGVRFELIDLELEQKITTLTYVRENQTDLIRFDYEFDVEFCGVYDLVAVLFRNEIDYSEAFPIIQTECINIKIILFIFLFLV